MYTFLAILTTLVTAIAVITSLVIAKTARPLYETNVKKWEERLAQSAWLQGFGFATGLIAIYFIHCMIYN